MAIAVSKKADVAAFKDYSAEGGAPQAESAAKADVPAKEEAPKAVSSEAVSSEAKPA